MSFLIYCIAFPFIWILSRLPFRALYVLSDIFYFLIYYIIRYRVKVVRDNLEMAFPDKTEKERLYIEKKSFQHMCDMFLEMVKTLHISENDLKKRFAYKNLEMLRDFESKNKSIILMLPHYANWEWSIILGTHMNYKGYGIYQYLTNKYFDNLVKKIRARFDATLVGIYDTTFEIRKNEHSHIRGTYLFLSDQTPYYRKGLHWDSFMGIEVPVHIGAEVLAKKFDLNILFLKVNRVKRGYYEAYFVPITDDARKETKFTITRRFLDLTEEQIKMNPEYYFWTHKRWKHKDKERI